MTTLDILYPTSQAMEVFKKQEEGEHLLHNLSYFCNICGKRFVSGRALGGHMRSHNPAFMAADTLSETKFQKSKRPRVSDEKSMEKKDNEEGLDGSGSNLAFALRRTPSCRWRLADGDYSFVLGHGSDSKPIDSSINCYMCGKEFNSWNGLISHIKSHSEAHQDSGDAHIEDSQKHKTQDKEEGSESDADIENDRPSGNSSRFDKWMKGKRSKRPRYEIQLNAHEQFGSDANNEEEAIAMCLLMLASGVNTAQNPEFQVGAEELPITGNLKLPITGSQLTKCIRKKPKAKKLEGHAGLYDDDEVKKARYKCSTCNKVFHSHQALGGHRSSHNKVKVSFQTEENERLEEDITDEEELIAGSNSQLPGNLHKPCPKERTNDSYVKAMHETKTIEPAAFSGKKIVRAHECSICHRVFASGQALGGHKRCHWVTAGASDSISTISSNKETPMQQKIPARVELLDLNLPAPVDDDCDSGILHNLGDNAVDSHRASCAQTQSPPYLQPRLMGSYRKQGLLLYSSSTHLNEDDEADSKTGMGIGFGKVCDSDFPVREQPWLRL